jgi:hypothetical protein
MAHTGFPATTPQAIITNIGYPDTGPKEYPNPHIYTKETAVLTISFFYLTNI